MLRLDFDSLRAAYQSGTTTPADLLEQVCDAAANAPASVWISLVPRETVLARARALQEMDAAKLPLYGIPFAVKDNIDVAGIETTAGCPQFAYLPEKSATIVQLLEDAGAVVIGKTNLDQFATGLNGTRSPYGPCHNALLPKYVSGGSSSGSSVTVALGIVSFSLGTDTAGSGRVPAALNNIVGLKPTRGVWSMTGVVPACRTQDTVSAFTLTASDAQTVFAVAAQADPSDPFSRVAQRNGIDFSAFPSWKIGMPDVKSLEFFGDGEYERLFAESVEAAWALGAEIVEVEFAPFLEAAKLLYEGPWVAERFRATQALLETNPDAMLPVTRQIIERGAKVTAVETFAAIEKLAELKKRCDLVWGKVDAIITPTIPTGYTIEQMQNDPIRLNSNLGFYTNFMNLLDYSAIAVPAGLRGDGLPFGVTFFAPAHSDEPLLHLGTRWQQAHTELTLGATPHHLPEANTPTPTWKGAIPVAVCGAHMSGLPLNVQLAQRGARLLQKTRSAPNYRFYALPGGPPQRPGMVRVSEGGSAIELEVWSVPIEAYGSFVAGIPSPLGIGTVELEDGSQVQGFVCEAVAAENAEDITAFGGWRSWLTQAPK